MPAVVGGCSPIVSNGGLHDVVIRARQDSRELAFDVLLYHITFVHPALTAVVLGVPLQPLQLELRDSLQVILRTVGIPVFVADPPLLAAKFLDDRSDRSPNSSKGLRRLLGPFPPLF